MNVCHCTLETWRVNTLYLSLILYFSEGRKALDTASTVLNLGPVYVEKRGLWKECHPLSQVNFNERLYGKKRDPFALSTALADALIRDFKIQRRDSNENVA